MTTLRLAIGLLLLCSCPSSREDASVRAQADWLCRYEQWNGPALSVLPHGEDPAAHFDPDDLAFLRDDARQAPFPELAVGAKALSAAFAARARCEIASLELDGADARVQVRRTGPRLSFEDRLRALTALANEHSDQARLTQAQQVASSAELKTEEFQLRLSKSPAGWRLRVGLRDRAR